MIFHYGPTVYMPEGFHLQEPVIVHDQTRHRFVWRETRWVHLARCPCWRQSPTQRQLVRPASDVTNCRDTADRKAKPA